MFNFITIIKPTIIPSIRRVREGLLFCEPNPLYRICGCTSGPTLSVYVCCSGNMSFLDIKDPAKRTAVVRTASVCVAVATACRFSI